MASGDLRLFGQPLEMVVDGHAEVGQHGQIPIHRVGVERGAADRQIIKAARAFADFVEADEKFAVGEPRERAAARQALEVNHPIEILFAQPADAWNISGQCRGAAQRRRSKRTTPARSGSSSSNGAKCESIHQKISASGRWRLSNRNTGSAWTTSPSELGLRMRIFNCQPQIDTDEHR